jgi:hypothetical protein
VYFRIVCTACVTVSRCVRGWQANARFCVKLGSKPVFSSSFCGPPADLDQPRHAVLRRALPVFLSWVRCGATCLRRVSSRLCVFLDRNVFRSCLRRCSVAGPPRSLAEVSVMSVLICVQILRPRRHFLIFVYLRAFLTFAGSPQNLDQRNDKSITSTTGADAEHHGNSLLSQ